MSSTTTFRVLFRGAINYLDLSMIISDGMNTIFDGTFGTDKNGHTLTTIVGHNPFNKNVEKLLSRGRQERNNIRKSPGRAKRSGCRSTVKSERTRNPPLRPSSLLLLRLSLSKYGTPFTSTIVSREKRDSQLI